jgi:hypothetical protein
VIGESLSLNHKSQITQSPINNHSITNQQSLNHQSLNHQSPIKKGLSAECDKPFLFLKNRILIKNLQKRHHLAPNGNAVVM